MEGGRLRASCYGSIVPERQAWLVGRFVCSGHRETAVEGVSGP